MGEQLAQLLKSCGISFDSQCLIPMIKYIPAMMFGVKKTNTERSSRSPGIVVTSCQLLKRMCV